MLIKKIFILIALITVTINEQTQRFENLNTLIKTYSSSKYDILNKKVAIIVLKQQMCMYCIKKLYDYSIKNKSDKVLFLINEEIVNNDEEILKNERNIIVPNAVIMRRDIGISSIGIIQVEQNKIQSITNLGIDNIDKNLNLIFNY